MRSAHRICGSAILALAIFCFREAVRTWDGLGGTGFFPLILGAIFTIQGLIFLLQNAAEQERERFPWPEKGGFLRLSLVFPALVLFLIFIPLLGYPLATILFLAGLTKVLGNLRWRYGFFLGAVTAAVTYAIFKSCLNMPLPAGILGI